MQFSTFSYLLYNSAQSTTFGIFFVNSIFFYGSIGFFNIDLVICIIVSMMFLILFGSIVKIKISLKKTFIDILIFLHIYLYTNITPVSVTKYKYN